MRDIIIKIYNYDELEEEVKQEIINNHINFICECMDVESINKNTNLYKAYKKSEEMQTPWFFGSYYFEYDKKNIMKEIKANEYYKNGKIYFD